MAALTGQPTLPCDSWEMQLVRDWFVSTFKHLYFMQAHELYNRNSGDGAAAL